MSDVAASKRLGRSYRMWALVDGRLCVGPRAICKSRGTPKSMP